MMDLKYKIDLLEKQVVELELQNDSLSQKLRAAQHEAEAMAATVESLRVAWEAVKATDWNKPLEEVFAATPQQHLLDVRAEAGRAGFIAGWVSWSAKGDVKVRSDNYAASVKAGVD